MIIPNKVKRLLSDSGRAALALMTVFLVVYFITVVSGSSAFVGDSAQKSALSYFEEDINRAETLVNAHYDNLYEIVEKVRYAETRAEVEAVIESYIGSDKFGDLRYYSQKKAYAANGALVTEELSGGEYISRLCTSDTRGCSPYTTILLLSSTV